LALNTGFQVTFVNLFIIGVLCRVLTLKKSRYVNESVMQIEGTMVRNFCVGAVAAALRSLRTELLPLGS